MQISDFSIRNPVKVAVGVILTWIFGLVALSRIPVQLTPEVTKPILSIQVRWPGASPTEIENEIVSKLEEELQDVEGMLDLTSTCGDGFGEIEMEFEVGSNMDSALVRVNSRLSRIRDYPPDADQPVLRTVSANSNRIAYLALIPRAPTHAELRAFLDEHPDLEQPLAHEFRRPVVDVPNLYALVSEYPALNELIKHHVNVPELRTFAEDHVAAQIMRVDGVAAADIFGGQENELRVVIDPARLAARRITVADLRAALLGENTDISAGDLWEGRRRYVVRTLGRFSDPRQVENVIVTYRNDAPVYVKDVARVVLSSRKAEGVSRQRGVNMLTVAVQRQDGANVLDVMAGIRGTIEQLNRGVLANRGLQLIQVYDETVYIDSAVSLVRTNIFVGGALASLVLLLFLRSGRSTLVVALSIPISCIGTFLVVWLTGRSVNVISLAGMAFAVGMVVDNAIVVLENIYSHYQRGETSFTAASRGASEVWGAVLASTLTTLAVFLPVIFIQEQAGQLFRDIAIAISAGVAISLVVSLTVIPSAASRLLVRQTEWNRAHANDAPGRLERAWRYVDARIQRVAGAFLRFIVELTETLQRGQLGRRALVALSVLLVVGLLGLVPIRWESLTFWPYQWPRPDGGWFLAALLIAPAAVALTFAFKRLAVAVTMIVLALGLSYKLMPGAEYLPEGNQNLVFASLTPPPGYNLNQMSALGEEVERRLAPYWEAIPGSAEAAALDGPLIDNFFLISRRGGIFMGARAVDPEQAKNLVPVLRRATDGLPGVISFVNQASLFERGLSGGRTIDIEITGPELEELIDIGSDVMRKVQAMYPANTETTVRPVPSLDLASPELHVRRHAEKAAQRGLDTQQLGYAVDALVDGAYAGTFWHEGKEINLVIYGLDDFSRRTQDVARLPINTPTGEIVAVGDVADVRLSSGPQQINRIDRQRSITIQVKPGLAIPLETAVAQIDAEILDPIRRSGRLGGTYQFRLAGTADDLKQMRQALAGSMILAVVITYLLIAGLYESFLFPLVIMVSVPMAAVGGFAGLRVLHLINGQPLDTLTMLGFIILVGTVVNNAILIVDQALNYMRHEGQHHFDAVRESVRGRVRPIFMSTTTTVLGMLPLVLFPGAGSELYRGLGSVVLGGLVMSTVFTLILVPMLFTLLVEAQQSWRDRLGVVGLARGFARAPETLAHAAARLGAMVARGSQRAVPQEGAPADDAIELSDAVVAGSSSRAVHSAADSGNGQTDAPHDAENGSSTEWETAAGGQRDGGTNPREG